ncbi:MAG TPA: fumarylacetoacetate hydrolase family protein [Firmicutes bacterium]|jgi:2-keto-4-pentenoate hydratase/2-oxohepta-3-ene-1,7-dioic acid hydratase in catechol pathway|nr:fumarylacetoacetate hydrolase family protein [Bacillota bacterium]
MKLTTFKFNGQLKIGAVLADNHILDLQRACALQLAEEEKDLQADGMAQVLIPGNMVEFLRGGKLAQDAARKAYLYAEDLLRTQEGILGEWLFYPLEDVSLRAPLEPLTVIGAGPGLEEADDPQMHNYIEFYLKSGHTVVGPGAPILHLPGQAQNFDCNVELGVIIGLPGRHIPPEKIMEHIYGFTVISNVYCEKLQVGWEGTMFHVRYSEGTSFDNACPTGPYIVTREEVGDPENLEMKLFVNGTLRDSTNTKDLLRGIKEFVSYCSTFITLEPGLLILCGSPLGPVLGKDGDGRPVIKDLRQNPSYLKPGDRVRSVVEKVGALENPVVEWKGGQ